MLPELAREFGASMARTGQVVSVFAVVYGLAQLLYGAAGDRLGKLRVLTFTTVATAVESAACTPKCSRYARSSSA
jgi:predicted MFS family arabinose efflux permease